jgi:hypothetical protein
MTRHIVAASLAVLMFAAPAIALAQTPAPATTDAPKKAKHHHKKKAAPAADATTK